MLEPDRPFDDRALEEQYAAAKQLLLNPPAFQAGAILLLGTLTLFILMQVFGDDTTPASIAMLVGVILFHELGHYAGMQLFGYRNVKMFFIPFFGAAVSGRKMNVASWKEAIVSLLGPIPGIALGTALLLSFFVLPAPRLVAKDAALMLIAVNAFNLLPLAALDGGKFFQRILFSRHRWLEIGFQGVTGAGLGALAFALQSWVLGIFTYFVLIAIPRRNRLLIAAQELRARFPALTSDPTQLQGTESRAVFLAALQATPEKYRTMSRSIALAMEEMLDAGRRPPSIFASLLLFATWALGLLLATVSVGIFAFSAAPAEWKEYRYEDAGFIVELPHDPDLHDVEATSPLGEHPTQTIRATHSLVERYTVTHIDTGAALDSSRAHEWFETQKKMLSEQLDAPITDDKAYAHQIGADAPARELKLSVEHRTWHVRMYSSGSSIYVVSASAPRLGEGSDRFHASFRLIKPQQDQGSLNPK